jgi:hypothetical protein
MKPLSEWTVEELHKYIGPPDDSSHEVVDELLCRERERCAKACEAEAVSLISKPADATRTAAASALWDAAKTIRGLQ